MGLVKIFSYLVSFCFCLIDCVFCSTEASQFLEVSFIIASVSLLLLLYFGSGLLCAVFKVTSYFVIYEVQFGLIYVEFFDPFVFEF